MQLREHGSGEEPTHDIRPCAIMVALLLITSTACLAVARQMRWHQPALRTASEGDIAAVERAENAGLV